MIFEVRSCIVKEAISVASPSTGRHLDRSGAARQIRGHQHPGGHHRHQGRPESGRRVERKNPPKKRELEQRQNEINSLQDQLNKGQNTLSDAAKNDLYKNIESKKKSLQREVEDAQADLEAEQKKLMQQLGQKILAVIERYARDNGYTMVVDVESQHAGNLRVSQHRHHQGNHRALRQAPFAAAGAHAPRPSLPLPAAPKPAPKPAGTIVRLLCYCRASRACERPEAARPQQARIPAGPLANLDFRLFHRTRADHVRSVRAASTGAS